ncbi:MAG TPA: amidase family protein [Gemmatimonadaceae bacterium]|nr:amidase family protein [Gemmatimonadaceae bacterium]
MIRYLTSGCTLLLFLGTAQGQPSQPASAQIEEATVADLGALLAAGRLTCRQLVDHYLRRIETYDKNGPAINSIVTVNPRAREIADSLDGVLRRGAPRGPLHCIPVVVKDNFETTDMPTTAGSLSLAGYMAAQDAFQVLRVRAAGAVILAKSNMAEYAFSPYETVSSILPGYSRNPYALDRVTAGSSGGTAASVAANFATVGLGSDTGNSIRGPSAHQALVGIRSTMGLTSRGGVVPLFLGADIAGPMARTVADAVAVLQVIVGADPDDSVTARSRDRPVPNYETSLDPNGLRGARIGVLRQAYESPTTDPEVVQVFQRALADLRKQGATVVDSAIVPELDSLRRLQTGACNTFEHDLNTFLAARGSRVPVKSVDEILRSRRFHPSIEKRLETAQAVEVPPDENPACRSRDAFRAALRQAVTATLDRLRLDAVVYPSWSNPPRLIGDLNTPHGDNNQLFAPNTGFPAITVPMGYLRGGVLPAGLQFFGRAWSEPVLIRLAYAYEQATRHRRPPTSTPPLR